MNCRFYVPFLNADEITDYVEEGVGRGRGWGVRIAIAADQVRGHEPWLVKLVSDPVALGKPELREAMEEEYYWSFAILSYMHPYSIVFDSMVSYFTHLLHRLHFCNLFNLKPFSIAL
ncbi:hypothetical protein L1887_04030 [Cichorium endivia]|nr:hypothetical protein L1887_04030 [Cichorium endivia]